MCKHCTHIMHVKFPKIISSNGRPTRIDYPTFSREFSYDQLGRLTRLANCAASTNQALVTEQKYSADGNLKTVIGPSGNITVYQYDGKGRLIAKMDAEENEVQYEYDNRGNLIGYTDARGVRFYYEYNSRNQKVREILPNGKEITFEYDKTGNLTAVVDAKEQCIEIDYDGRGNVRERRIYDESDNLKKTVYFVIDKRDLLTSYSDENVAADCSYDLRGRKIRQIVSYGSFTKGHSYEYGSNGLKRSFTAPDGTKYDYEYDKDGNLTAIHIPSEGTITFGDYVVTQPGKVSLPNGQSIAYQYDDFLRTISIELKPCHGLPVHELFYSYLPCGQVGSITHNGTQKSFHYDKVGRLIFAPEGTYNYDESGNRIAAPLNRSSWIYDENNQLLSDDRNRYFYDANGSLVGAETAEDIWSFVYNEEGRLSAVDLSKQGRIAEYFYDPFGRRIQKNVCGVVTYYHYTDEGLVAEYDVNGSEIRSYGYKPHSLWGTAPLWLKQDGQYFWFLNDRLGTPQKLVDSLGNVIWGKILKNCW